jgi:flagellar assembly factor FliW
MLWSSVGIVFNNKAFENQVLAFEKGVLAFENQVLAFEKGVLACENQVLAFEKGVLAFEKGVLAFEKGYSQTWWSSVGNTVRTI